MEKQKKSERTHNLLEIRGILRTLADHDGQSICKPERLLELNEFLREMFLKEQLKRKVYPIVLVNKKLGLLRIVNRNSTTSFKLESHETKAELDKIFKEEMNDEWTPEHEVEMAISGAGFHRIHETDDDRWELWEAGK